MHIIKLKYFEIIIYSYKKVTSKLHLIYHFLDLLIKKIKQMFH